jgi:4-amino-4-deoxy-L-arabinose transferase-like glycosyltransferase
MMNEGLNKQQQMAFKGIIKFNDTMKIINSHQRLAFLLGILIIILIHVSSFFVPHIEGDEVVYLTLAKEMNWDFSHYTTKDAVGVNQFAQRLYREALFYHPPLYPFIIKVFNMFGDPIMFVLLFGTIVHILIYVLIVKSRNIFYISMDGTILMGLLTIFCPIIAASTNRIHIDGLLGFLGLASVLSFINAFKKKSLLYYSAAGIVAGLCLNAKYSAIFYIPTYFLLCLFGFCIREKKLLHKNSSIISYMALARGYFFILSDSFSDRASSLHKHKINLRHFCSFSFIGI